MKIKIQNYILIFLSFLIFYGCGLESEDILEALTSENKNSLNTKASMTINPTNLGEVSAKIKDQTSKLFGAGIVFPEGSLAKQDTSFTLNLESGQTNITTQVLNDLDTKNISSITIETTHPSLLASPSSEVKIASAFTVAVPISSFGLNLAQNPERLTIFYKIYDFS